MTVGEGNMPEAERLERLWAEEFGDRYVERNAAAGDGRDSFWRTFVEEWRPRHVLEVGCNVGANLRWLVDLLPGTGVYGVDINELALEYFAEEEQEVPYRGHEGALFRRDYGGLYREHFPELTLLESGRLSRDEGWDDVTWWLFERP